MPIVEKRLIYEAEKVARPYPELNDPRDKVLFDKELERNFPATYLYHCTNIRVHEHSACFDGIQVLPFTLENVRSAKYYNWRTLLRLVIKQKPVKVRQYLHFTAGWSHGYFHWMCDALPRLLALEPYWTTHEIVLPHVYNLPFVLASLQMLGLKATILQPNTYVKAKHLVTCGMVAPTGNYRPAIMTQLSQRLRQHFQNEVSPVGGPKIFISRSKAPRRYIEQEAELHPILTAHGYQIVHMEDYSLAQQAAILHNATHVIGLHGAGLTNMLFLPPGAHVVELRFSGDSDNNAYFSLAHALGLHYHYLLGDATDGRKIQDANITIDKEKLQQMLQSVQ